MHPTELSCPECGAEPGQPCQGRRGDRKSFHRARGSRQRRAISPSDHNTESPIETIMASALAEWIEHHDADAALSTQVKVGPYRADILIDSRRSRLVVECDGAAFHNGADQIQRDKARDRYFVAQDIAVMRFTGSEIQRDPRGCAAQVGIWIRGRK